MNRESNHISRGPGVVDRRRFLQTTALAFSALAWDGLPGWAAGNPTAMPVASLPAGAAPAPVATPHFPSRLHAFVWRNWQLVPLKRQAEVIGARRADLLRLGRAMGLEGPPRITADQQRRSALTVIRRNWHLLPYEQLLQLLGWTAEEMAYSLREDDFLYVKLGNLKPRCEPLRYQAPNASEQARAEEIARVVRAEFPGGAGGLTEPLFDFISQLSRPVGRRPAARPSAFNPRFCYSYFALYGDPLLDPSLDPYPDGYLDRLAESGVNGVWLQAVLGRLAPFPWDPKVSEHCERRRENLRALAERARRHGLGVWLYLNEPRSLPTAFYHAHPELKGVVEGDYAALCTSVPETRAYLAEAVASICRAAPQLAGFFTISGSENLTHCWSHQGGAGCPRCGRRAPAEVIAELHATIQEGIHKSGAGQKLIAWDWGWPDAWVADIVARLPREAMFMSVSEWGMPIERGGVRSNIGEYSLSSIGPGERSLRNWKLARAQGLRAMAKVQSSNTWELSAVPYIPAVENAARHAANLGRAGVNGLMLGWTLGGYPSPNLEVVSELGAAFAAGEPADPEAAMARVARRRFGDALAPAMVRAWKKYSAAFREFPFDGGVVYRAPMQMGPANPIWGEPSGYASTMVGFPYDDLAGWRSLYPAEVFVGQLEKVADGFESAFAEIQTALSGNSARLSSAQTLASAAELRVQAAAAIHFRSAANQARFVMARERLRTATAAAAARPEALEMERLLRAEIVLARRLHALQCRDSRLGFEASNEYFYVPVDLVEKVINCHDLLARWLPAQARA
jgi:hypothetical protein